MQESDLQHLAHNATSIIKKAGTLILHMQAAGLHSSLKEDGSVVTDADVKCQDFLIEHLSALFPPASFYAEEKNQHSSFSNHFSWVIDPIDGTTNYLNRLPHFCISVALTYNNDPLLALIYQPIMDECYVAIKNKGAFLNGNRISVSSKKQNKERMIIAIGHSVLQSYTFNKLFSLRILGSAALDLAYLASGKLGAVLYEQLAWWDVAAGILLVNEAGGMVTTYEGNPLSPSFNSIVATSSPLHASFMVAFHSKQ